MRIEIFVVETEINKIDAKSFDKKNRIEAYLKLFKCKTDLIRLYGGLTETDFKGYWCNNKTNTIDSDIGKIWLIYTGQSEPELLNILLRIKKITKQTSQAYSINENMEFI